MGREVSVIGGMPNGCEGITSSFCPFLLDEADSGSVRREGDSKTFRPKSSSYKNERSDHGIYTRVELQSKRHIAESCLVVE